MPFVKLDCGLLDSTLWVKRDERELFITSLLMAEPYEVVEPMRQIEVRTLNETDFEVPPGWYGFVPAAGVGIIRRAQLNEEIGLDALERLGYPDPESRSPEFEGRRMVRVNGGYLILNYQKYRERDYTTAERSRRYRERKFASRRGTTASHRDITQAEGEVEAKVEVKELTTTTLPRGLSVETWEAFKENRKALKAKLTPRAEKMILEKLTKWSSEGYDPESILCNSIENGWKGIFAPTKSNKTISAVERVRRANS